MSRKPESTENESPAAVARGERGDAEAPIEAPIDLEPLHLICEGDLEAFRELVETYCEQTSECLQKLQAALREHSAADVHFLAHSCKGASANCGMNPIAKTMGELERMGREDRLDGADELLALAQRQFAHIEAHLREHLEQGSDEGR